MEDLARLQKLELTSEARLERAAIAAGSGVAELACWALGRLGYVGRASASHALLRALMRPERDVRAAAARALVFARPRSEILEGLARAVDDPEAEVRSAAAYALGSQSDERAVQLLADLARRDQAEQVRDIAVEALGNIGGPVAARAIRRALSDQSVSVRTSAIEAIESAQRSE